MFLVTQVLTMTRALIELLLTAYQATIAAPLFTITSTVRLYSAGPPPSSGRVLTDYTECVFDGYATVTLTAGVGPINLPGGTQGLTKTCNWLRTGTTDPPISALGYMIVASDGTTLLAVEQFAAPVPFNGVGDSLDLQVILAPRVQMAGQNG